MPGWEFRPLWGADHAPTFPDDGGPTAQPSHLPPVGGYRFMVITVPPGIVSVPPGLDLRAGLAEMEEKLPGVLARLEPDNPGMHTTDTIDFEVVLSGEVILELDDGVEKVLRPGDTVVQNGTRHRWGNRGTEPAVMAVFTIGPTVLASDPDARQRSFPSIRPSEPLRGPDGNDVRRQRA